MKTIMNKILAACIMTLSVGVMSAQDTQSRSNVSNGGGWLSKSSYTLYGTFGQPGVASNLISDDGVWSGSVGFIGPVNNIGQNNAPIAITNDFPVFTADSLIQLQGFDPDDDPITFEVVTDPTLGSVSLVDGGEFKYTPNAGLNPGQLYSDELTYKVNDGRLDSEEAVWSFQFILEDTPQVINGLSYAGNTLNLSWSDEVPNSSYVVNMQYYDLSDPATAGLKDLLVDETYTAGEIGTTSTDFNIDFEISQTEDPYFSSGNTVLVIVRVNPPNSEGTTEVFELNTANGRAEASEDGEFFAFGTNQILRENGQVELSFYGAELGDFEIGTSIIEILNEGTKGTITTPINVSTSDILKEWMVTYESIEEIGGLDSIQFRVFSQDRQLFDTAWLKVEIVDVNDPPKLSSIANQVTEEDTQIQVAIDANDPDNAYSVIVESNESTLVPATYDNGIITISPQNDFSGRVSVSVVVTENDTDESYVAYQRFDVEVLDVDDAPVVDAIPNATIEEDNALTFIATASDVDATLAIFTYGVELSDPSAFEVEIDGNTIRLIPLENINGEFQVTVFADDGLGKPTSISEGETFDLTVTPVNDAPEIIQTFPTQQIITNIPDYTIDLSAYFTDVENGSDLTYTFVDNAEISLSLSETILTVAPSDSFNSLEEVDVVASDGEFEVSQKLTFVYVEASVNVVVANEVTGVVLQEDFGTSTLDISNVFENTNDANALFEYSLTGGSFINANIDNQGLITFSSKENFSGTETFYLVGEVNGEANFTSFTVEVTPVNDPPIIAELSNQEIAEDQTLSGLFLAIEDVDNALNELTIEVASSNTEVIVASDITRLILSGGYSFALSPLDNANGTSAISITIDDGGGAQTISFDLEVLAVNDDPIKTVGSIESATQGENYSLILSSLFDDVDGDALSYSVIDQPEWLSLSGNMLTGIPANADVGIETFKIRVDDSNGGAIVETFDLTVENVNDAPIQLIDLSDLDLLEDFSTSSFDLNNSFEDIDGDALTYSAFSDNESVVSIAVSGSELTLTEAGNGFANVEVTVDDGNGGIITATFSVTVTNVNDAPEVVAAIVDQEVNGGFNNSQIDLSGTFTDEDGDVISFSANSSNTSIVSVSVSGSVLSITEVGSGTATVTVTGSDGNGGSSSFEFDVTVIPLGFDDPLKYSIYPNPVSDKLFIKGSYSLVGWKFIDTSGKVILNGRTTQGQPIDVSGIQVGLYYLVLEEIGKSLKVIIR